MEKTFNSDFWCGSYILSFLFSAISFSLSFNNISIILLVLGVIFLVIGNIVQRKEGGQEVNRINNLKSLYESTKEPLLISRTQLSWTQNQTRQILTGALTYAQPKEYSLHINCTNISDKTITAVEFEIKTLNAFNEEVSSFVVSTRKQLLFGKTTECSWDLSGSFDINNTKTEVKRVMFSDGTTWNK